MIVGNHPHHGQSGRIKEFFPSVEELAIQLKDFVTFASYKEVVLSNNAR